MPQRTPTKRKHWVDFKAIKEAASFEPILARYGIQVTAKGQELVGRCPFHEDARPSFRVNVGKRVFHCFGCHAKGNVLDFVSRKEGVTIKRAAELVAGWCGLRQSDSSAARKLAHDEMSGTPPPTAVGGASTRASATSAEGTPSANAEASAAAATTTTPAREEKTPEGQGAEAMKPLTFTLKLDPEHPYLKERGLTPETIAHFGLGYCSKGMMRGRIAIPIHNEAGELVAYAGRWVGKDEDLPEGEGKYKLPPRFEKSRVLFNLHRIPRWAVKRVEEVILVEGYFSVFWLHQNGWPNAVSVMGSSVSHEQRKLLGERFDRVQIFFDGDDAGRRAGETVALDLTRDLYVRTVECPSGRQPDQLSAEDLKGLLGDPART